MNFLRFFLPVFLMEDKMVFNNSAEIRQTIRESYEKVEQFRSYL